MRALVAASLSLFVSFSFACRSSEPHVEVGPDADARGHAAATEFTLRANAEFAAQLPLADVRDFDNARRGLLAADPEIVIERDDGTGMVWDTRTYAFVAGDAPPSVNPSLWRQAKLNRIHGLFEVVDGVYQVRGYDLSNLTLIRGASGWIVVDPLTSVETARAAFALASRHLGERPISAVIFTHSHVDHFGGVAGILDQAAAERANVPIIAPAGFMEEATSENILAGPTMTRRAAFMYGMPLARSERGHVDTGLGVEPARGRVGILPPTVLVDRTPQAMTIDGVEFVFQYVPDSEAPAELTFYLPHVKAFCGAEIVSHTMHNLYTPRGAKVRDALRWSGYIDEAIALFADAEVVFASHHWPVWGRAEVADYLAKQRDTYKFIHDQTLRLAASGATPREIAEQLELPEALRTTFANRGYYGTVRHNAKAVYQAYFGWYDGNPANLDPLPPQEAGAKYVEFMGGAAEVRRKAQAAYDNGEYRWVAMVLDHLVMAEPGDGEARALLARAYDQLGYQAESGPWRDIYLTGAHELRHGPMPGEVALAEAMELLRQVPIEQFLTAMAAALNGPKADGESLRLNFIFTDIEEEYVLTVANAVLHARRGAPDPEADATVRLTREFFLRLVTRQLGVREAIFSDDVAVEGSRLKLLSFFSLLDQPDLDFAIVTP